MRVGGVFETFRLSGYMHTIGEPTYYQIHMMHLCMLEMKRELKEKDIKEILYLEKKLIFKMIKKFAEFIEESYGNRTNEIAEIDKLAIRNILEPLKISK